MKKCKQVYLTLDQLRAILDKAEALGWMWIQAYVYRGEDKTGKENTKPKENNQ